MKKISLRFADAGGIVNELDYDHALRILRSQRRQSRSSITLADHDAYYFDTTTNPQGEIVRRRSDSSIGEEESGLE